MIGGPSRFFLCLDATLRTTTLPDARRQGAIRRRGYVISPLSHLSESHGRAIRHLDRADRAKSSFSSRKNKMNGKRERERERERRAVKRRISYFHRCGNCGEIWTPGIKRPEVRALPLRNRALKFITV